MNKTEYLLVCLMEEAAEIQQLAAKALRFGLDNHHPERGTTNAQELSKECTDFLAVSEMLEAENALLPYHVSQLVAAKKAKVEHFMELSRGWGTLVDKPPAREDENA